MTAENTSSPFQASPMLLEAIMESDAAYFDAGAVLEPVAGAVIARMQGLEDLPSACVVHRIDPQALPADLNGWLATIEERLMTHGVALSRIYLQEEHSALEQTLFLHGYQCRAEEAVAMEAFEGELRFSLRPIVTDADWDEKLSFHREIEYSSDGHRSDPWQWVELERRKCNAGYMDAFFIVEKEEIVGAVSSSRAGDMLRAKNLLVHPGHRGRGIASGVIRDFAHHAFHQGFTRLGAFRLADASTAGFYHNAGCIKLGQQSEWTKDLKA